MSSAGNKLRTRFFAAIAGTGLVALCCFSPALVLLLAAIGLSSITPYLDFVLLPGLVILIIVALRTYHQWQKT